MTLVGVAALVLGPAIAAGAQSGDEVGALAVHTVTNGTDADPGSYRAAIIAANADVDPVTINFDPGLTTVLTTADVVYTNSQPITINGNGSTIDGSDLFRLLVAASAPSVTINDLTMADGAGTEGAAIDAGLADLVLNDSTFSGNTVTGDGGAIELSVGSIAISSSTFTDNNAGLNGGAIRTSDSDYTISNSTFTDNHAGLAATRDGGAIQTSEGDFTITDSTFSGNTSTRDGGAIRSAVSNFTISNSTFSLNAGEGGGGDGGAIQVSEGSFTISNSTFDRNATPDDGGAIRVAEGAITATNSTFTGNSAGEEGGALRTFSASPVALTYVTMSGNGAPIGATVHGEQTPLVAYGSVLADPVGGANCEDVLTTSNGYNFSTDAACDFTGTGDTEDGPDPQLGALGDNGGPTPTMLPALTSPLVDAIPLAACEPGVTADQRGLPRPADADDDGVEACDIGAVELQPAPPPPEPIVLVPTFTG
jgi:predicted outer membrane repeat protein